MEPKKRTITLELTDAETEMLLKKCYADGTTPAEFLSGAICDLVFGAKDGIRTRGSDEREFIHQYYNRCGYGYFYPLESQTFLQWLLSSWGYEDVISALDDIKTLEEEIAYYRERPEEYTDEDIDELERDIKDSKDGIESIYQHYIKGKDHPEALEKGLEGVKGFAAMLEAALKEGTI